MRDANGTLVLGLWSPSPRIFYANCSVMRCTNVFHARASCDEEFEVRARNAGWHSGVGLGWFCSLHQ